MSVILRGVLAFCVLVYFIVIILLMKRKKLTLRYSLIWLMTGIVMVLLDVFPIILIRLSELLGIQTPSNGLFAVFIFAILLILLSLTSIVSKQSENIKSLAQRNALLEKRIRDLEKNKDKK